MITLQDLIKQIDSLKPMSQIASQVLAMAEDHTRATADVAEIISYDPLITANLIKMCNSAYFGLSRQIDSVHEAITLLGLKQVVELVVLKSASGSMKKKQEGYGLGEGELWRHSVSNAFIARALDEKLGGAQKHLLFTAALLKDIGKVVLNRFVIYSIEKIQDLVNSQGYSFIDAEKAVIGLNHAEVGGAVAEKWKFSKTMAYIIRNHHLPDDASMKKYETAIVYLSEVMCQRMGIGGALQGADQRIYNLLLKRLSISDEDVQEITLRFEKNRPKLEALIGML